MPMWKTLAAFLLLAACGGSAAAEPPLLLEHATLIDGRGGPPQADMSVLVDHGRIASVFRSGARDAPRGAIKVDLTGRYIIPGLIDSHVHLHTRARDPGVIEQILRQVLLRSGVTTVRDMGGNGARLAPLARNARAGKAVSPDTCFPRCSPGRPHPSG